tara:strand:+ start:398 stop:571 length:174 start_codon:yes stop_codon:yes gene_type:complete
MIKLLSSKTYYTILKLKSIAKNANIEISFSAETNKKMIQYQNNLDLQYKQFKERKKQ